MVTITVSVVRRAFSSMVHPGTGFPVPSFSTPDILTVIDFPHKKNRSAGFPVCGKNRGLQD
ncbi:hypothetical protein BGK51_23520 [Shigella sp. FC569]|nr:hypothetical protein BGK51_23520 [Shigella sp. FC569]